MATTSQDQQRFILLQTIFNVFLQQHPVRTVLYPGAGADIFNPYMSTHATDYTFVEHSIDLSMLKMHILEILGDHTTITMLDDHTLTAGTITIHLLNVNYETYLQGADHTQYDVLFDKDSWLKDENGQIIVSGMLSKLRNDGVWITNTNLGTEWVKDLLNAIGLLDLTDQLGQLDRTYGIYKVRVYRKQHINMDAFKIVYTFCDSIASICNTLDAGERITKDEVEIYKDHLEAAPFILNTYPQLQTIAKQICDALVAKVQAVAK